MTKPDLYERRRSNAFNYTPSVFGGGPPQCWWAPTKSGLATDTSVAHNRPTRVYGEWHLKAIGSRI